jgi:hypothetical protein
LLRRLSLDDTKKEKEKENDLMKAASVSDRQARRYLKAVRREAFRRWDAADAVAVPQSASVPATPAPPITAPPPKARDRQRAQLQKFAAEREKDYLDTRIRAAMKAGRLDALLKFVAQKNKIDPTWLKNMRMT